MPDINATLSHDDLILIYLYTIGVFVVQLLTVVHLAPVTAGNSQPWILVNRIRIGREESKESKVSITSALSRENIKMEELGRKDGLLLGSAEFRGWLIYN